MRALTHNSRSAHGVISEPHMSTHDRKGREGKGRETEGMGAHVETSHHVVGLGDVVAPRLGMMSEAKG